MNARETANRHGDFVVAGNMRSAMADFTPEALQKFQARGVFPPRGANTYEVVNERQEGDRHIYEITYRKDQESVTLRSTWGQVGDEWKIVDIEPVS